MGTTLFTYLGESKMANDTPLATTLNQLSEKLEEYLKMKGVVIEAPGLHRCINPNHEDRHPSSSIGGKEEFSGRVTHCFSCGGSYSIFHAAHFLDNKPMSGPDFFQDTLPFLAKMFDVPYEPIQVSEDTKREYQKRRAYEDAVNAAHSGIFTKDKEGRMVLRSDHPAIKHLLDRGITEATIRKFKIGCISNFKDYMASMKKLGWDDKTYLEAADLANNKLFSPTGIIIPIFDEKTRPVGFVTRRTDMKENEKGQEKYVNSQNSDIYHKSKILFNFNNYEEGAGPLYVVEGYLDAVYLTQAGIKNVAAIGATVLTEEHVDLLFTKKIRNIILCLDADEGGNRGVKLAIERLSVYKTFNVRIMELPKDSDPDNYVREHGPEKFVELSKSEEALSPFAWMLKHTTFEDDPMEIAQKAIPTIAAEESNIVRLKMIRELSRLTGLEESDIRKDVDSLINKESSRFLEELAEINNFIQVQLSRKKIKDTKSIIEDSLIKIKNLERQHNNTVDNKTEFTNKIDEIKVKIESGKYTYGLRPNKFERLYKNFDGIPYGTCLTLIGGRPSAGKTALLTSLLINVIDSDKEACVFYMSIDDTTELMTLKILAVLSGLSTSQIKNYVSLEDEDKEKINAAWHWIETNSDRFIMVDATAGNTYEALEMHVDWFMKNIQTKKKIFALDNFHKLRHSGFGRGGKKTEAVADQSERIKELTQINDLHLIATVELRKLEGTDSRPTLGDLKDSVQLEYDADVVILAHNDMQVNDKTLYVWQGAGEGGSHTGMPYIEAKVWKNKITGRCGKFYYKLNSWNLRVAEESVQEIMRLEAQAKKTTDGQNRLGKAF